MIRTERVRTNTTYLPTHQKKKKSVHDISHWRYY